MDIPWLEEHLRQHPLSPLFARLAAEYSAAGRNAEAIDLCRNGVIHLPAYATGHLVLAKCYARESNFALALASLAEAKAYAGDFPGYQPLFDEWSARASREPEAPPPAPAPQQQPEEQDEAVIESPAESFTPPESRDFIEPPKPEAEPFAPAEELEPPPPSEQETELSIPPESQEFPPPSKPEAELTVSPEAYEFPRPSSLEVPPPPPPDRVPPARVTTPEPSISSEELEQIKRPPLPEDDEGRIISKTLAEIFASQGEFDEAIVTYRLLLQMKPELSDEITQRIDELCRLREEKQAQQSIPPPPVE